MSIENMSKGDKQALFEQLREEFGNSSPDPKFEDGEEQSSELRSDVAAGAASARPDPVNIWNEARQGFEDDLSQGDTQSTAMAKFFSKVNYAAMSSDPKLRDQVDYDRHFEEHKRRARIERQSRGF